MRAEEKSYIILLIIPGHYICRGENCVNNENFHDTTKTSPQEALIANEEREIKLMILMRPASRETF